MKKEQHVNLSCSFCGKSQREVRKLIAGPTVYICDECIKLCNDIIAEENDREEGKPQVSLPTPGEIKGFLEGGPAPYIRPVQRGRRAEAIRF